MLPFHKTNKLKWLALPCLLYCFAVLLLVSYQRSLIYHPRLADTTLPPTSQSNYIKPVNFKITPTETVQGWWIHHDNNLNLPTVLYCHGNGANLNSYNQVAQLFYSFGWNALIFDYRGFGASTPAQSGLSQDVLYADAEQAYRWLLESGVLEKNLFVWGHSLGSAVAAHVASQHTPAALVLEGSFPDLYSMSRYRYPWAFVPPFLIWDKFNTADSLSKFHGPLLFLHAEQDNIIPYQMGQRLFAQASEPKTWINIGKIGHNNFPDVAEEFRERIQGFVNGALRRE